MTQPASSAPAPFPIVGIGASAGGVEALEGLFRGLPDRPGLAIVVVTHLSPQRESLLPEIIARFTPLPVLVAADGQEVARDHVYVLPADASIGIAQGRLRLFRPASQARERKPVDIFLSELAADQGEHAVGVILSGGDGDGTLGIKAIKQHGGLAIAQVADGHGPRHPDMPDSAIGTGLVDFAVPADAMGARLVEFARTLHAPDGGPDGVATLDDARAEICAILRNQVGHDFAAYKPRGFMRRVQRRMHVNHTATLGAYLEQLRQDPQEVGALFRDLLISVTNFFRDAEAFAALEKSVIPRLFEGRGAQDVVRVWVPGCATGEEVYSIAILLREHMDRLVAVPQVQLFATDIDERALSVARAARYPTPLLDGVSPARLARYFVEDGGSHVLAKQVRDLCVFSAHNVLRDPPFSRIDLVSCRNLLIYFGSEAQNQVIPIFHYALRPDGHLFLGTSENIGGFSDLFLPVDKKQRIFRRRSDTATSVRLPLAIGRQRAGPPGEASLRGTALGGVALRQAVEGQVLDRFAPAYVVVNAEGDVAYFSPRTGRYLEAAAGAPSRQLLTMARKSLRLELRAALRDAVEAGRPAVRQGAALEEEDGRVQRVTLTVDRLRDAGREDPLFLVVFADEGHPAEAAAPDDARSGAQAVLNRLEQELRDTRERLQSTIEEYESALEELKVSNEELVSLNEELQSTNEELEASKEELQSVNEELQTVNLELHTKVEALDRANDDLHNLFDSSDVATVFLDPQLRIRSFTPAATRIFNLLPADHGRPITDLSSRLSLPTLAADIDAVLASGTPLERRLDHDEGEAHFLVRLAPYRNGGGRTDGVVVSFVDVTSLTSAERHQRLLVAELQHRTRNLLNVVQAIVVQTLGRERTPKALTERLAALGRAQGLISEAKGAAVDIAEVVHLELQAYANSTDGRVEIAGPKLALATEHVQIMALALHELTTNAVKHGALRAPGGRLSVTWRLVTDGERHLVLDWRESGVAMASQTPPRGFGRELIERALAYTAQARSDMNFGPDGLACRIELPLAL